MKLFICTAFFFASIPYSGFILAAGVTADDLAGRIDLEVPQSAGFAILGVTPDKIIDPQSGRDFGLALLQGLDSNGNFQSGFALETRPSLWGQPKYIAEPNAKERFLSGFKFSLATASGSDSKDSAKRLGLGLNWTYQFNDPLHNKNLKECITKLIEQIPNIPDPDKDKELKGDAARCYDTHISWNVDALSIGTAISKSKQEDLGLNQSGYGIWITGSKVIGHDGELLGHIRHVDDQVIVGKDGLATADSDIFAVRYRFGGKTLRGIIEASRNNDVTKNYSDKYSLVSIGAEFEVSKGMWFRVAYGDTLGSSREKRDFFSGQLRFGAGEQPLTKF